MITGGLCNSFKAELGRALHDFTPSTGHVFKMALYTEAATLNTGTTAYDPANEVQGEGYQPGGQALVNVMPIQSGEVTIYDFNAGPNHQVVWPEATITARGALIYNATNGNRAVLVIDFGQDYTSTKGAFKVTIPVADETHGLIVIG